MREIVLVVDKHLPLTETLLVEESVVLHSSDNKVSVQN